MKCEACDKEAVPGKRWCAGHLALADCDEDEAEDEDWGLDVNREY